MAGVGKSTLARRVGKRLQLRVIDLDDEIVARERASIAELFRERGEIGFRVAEHEALRAVLAEPGPAVLAAGGGVVVAAVNRVLLRSSFCVWLDAPVPVVVSRLASAKAVRPLVAGDLAVRTATLMAQRADWYRDVANVRFDVTEYSNKELVERVVESYECST